MSCPQDEPLLHSLRSAVLGIVADGEAANEQLWAVQQQVAGIAALCGGDNDPSAELDFGGEPCTLVSKYTTDSIACSHRLRGNA